MNLVNGSSLCCLVLDWIKRFFADSEEEEKRCNMDQFFEKTHLLYLALDNSLQDCTDLPSGDVSDTDIVQDYKKMSLKNQVQHNKNRRKGTLQPAKPRILIYNYQNADDECLSVKQLEPDWNMIGVDKVGGSNYYYYFFIIK